MSLIFIKQFGMHTQIVNKIDWSSDDVQLGWAGLSVQLVSARAINNTSAAKSWQFVKPQKLCS